MIPAADLAVALVVRALRQQRELSPRELVLATVLLAGCAMARPPYLALGLLIFLPRWPKSSRKSWRKSPCKSWTPAISFVSIAAACAAWRLAVQPFGMDTAEEADPGRQLQFLQAHPLSATAALLRGTGEAAWDLLHRGLYVVGWNDLLPHHGAALLLTFCLLPFALCMPPLALRGWWRWALLLGAVVGPLLGLSLAEYIIWTPPGLRTVYGLQPRYWLPVLPAATLLAGCLRKVDLHAAQSTDKPRPTLLPAAWPVPAAALAMALVACTLPWMEAHAFYRTGLLQALRLNWP